VPFCLMYDNVKREEETAKSELCRRGGHSTRDSVSTVLTGFASLSSSQKRRQHITLMGTSGPARQELFV